VLFLGAVTSIGCVIPTSLQVVEQPQNYPPVFVVDLCTPSFGPVTPATSGPGSLVAPHIVVDDLDAASGSSNNKQPEAVTARIFRLDTATGTRFYERLEIPLNNANPLMTPNRYEGDFPQTNWCGTFGGAAQTTVIVIVADRPFLNTPGLEDKLVTDMLDGGTTSINSVQASWTLNCQ